MKVAIERDREKHTFSTFCMTLTYIYIADVTLLVVTNVICTIILV